MANNKEEINTEKQLPKESINKDTNQIKSRRPFIVMIVILISSLALSCWSLVATCKLQKRLNNEPAQFKTLLKQQTKTQLKLQEELKTKLDNLKQAQNTVQEKIAQTDQQLQSFMNLKSMQNQDWLLIKARYYLEMAQLNAYWANDLNAAIVLLSQADKSLDKQQSPKIFEIRQAMAKEINLLKAVPKIDTTGLLSQLDAAQLSVSQLKSPALLDKTFENTDPTTNSTTNWQTRIINNVSSLKKLVVVRRDDEEISPLMSPLFESIIKESIALNLQSAQWAVLNHDTAVFQLALKQALANLKKFDEKASDNAALIKQLSDLQKITITQPRTKIDLALPLLNKLISDTNDTPVEDKGETKP